jgi:hypothetical protein
VREIVREAREAQGQDPDGPVRLPFIPTE